MPLPKPAFFQSDRRPQWRSALAGLAVGLRLRFRRNPGFVMATGAGSIGLILALLLLFNGGLKYLSRETPAEIAENPPELGEPADDVPAKPAADNLEPAVAPQPKPRFVASQREPVREKSPSEDENRDDSFLSERSDADSLVSAVSRGKVPPTTKDEPPTGDDPFQSEDMVDERPTETEAAVEPVSPAIAATPQTSTIAGLHDESEEEPEPEDSIITKEADDERLLARDEPISKQPIAQLAEEPEEEEEEAEPVPAKASPPARKDDRLFADDEAMGGASEDENTAPATRPGTTTIVKTPAKASPPVPPVTDEDDGAFAPPQSKASEAAPVDSNPSKSGWKYSTTKPQKPVREPQKDSTSQSQSVETAVYATPEEKPKTVAPKTVPVPVPVPEKRPLSDSPVTLAIQAPRNVAPGKTFSLEFVVTNTTRATIQGATLSVTLPAGLSHTLGPELEHSIERLVPGEVHRVRLAVKATGSGEVTPKADVAIKGQPGPRSTTTLRVGTIRGASGESLPPCACEPAVRYIW